MANLQKREWAQGWPTAIAAAVGIGLGMGTVAFYTLGVFAISLARPQSEGGLGFSPEQVMLAFPIYTGGVLLFSPIAGALADRLGVRRVVLGSIILFSLVFMTLGLNPGSLWLYALTWAAISLFGAGTLPITFTRVVNNWFMKDRGLALGVAMVATGLCGGLAKLFALEMVEMFGWRAAYALVGMLPMIISLPVCLVAFRDVGDDRSPRALAIRFKPVLVGVALIGALALATSAARFALPQIAEHGYRMELVTAIVFGAAFLAPMLVLLFGRVSTEMSATSDAGAAPPPRAQEGVSFLGALQQWRFWLLLVVFTPIGFVIGGALPNIELVLLARAFAPTEAVGLAALVGLAIIAGRLVGGYLIDHLWPPGVTFIISAAPALALFALSGEVSHLTATASILLIGFGAGVEFDFLAFLVARYFGLRSYGVIYGALFGMFSVGVGLGAFAYAAAARQDYLAAFLNTNAIVLATAATLILLLGKAPTWTTPHGETKSAARH